MNIVPTIIEKSSNKEYAYDLYSRLLKDRIIFITGEINANSANIIVSELLYLDSINNYENKKKLLSIEKKNLEKIKDALLKFSKEKKTRIKNIEIL